MNNFQQMLKTAQMAQKKHEEFKKKVFEFSKQGGLINLSVTGNYKVTLNINFQDLLESTDNDFEMVNDLLQVAINEAIAEVKKAESSIVSL